MRRPDHRLRELQSVARPADVALCAHELGVARATRHSFARSLLRRGAKAGWDVQTERFDVDAAGSGVAVYRVDLAPGCADPQTVRLVAFLAVIDESRRTDRVIAEAWDLTAALCRGEVDDDRIAALRANVPEQEQGRADSGTLIWTRANRSVRFFDHVVGRLASGQQPDPAVIGDDAYLMRSTAFYGNGKWGLVDFGGYDADEVLAVPYRAQMLTAWLVRELSLELVEHCAAARNPRAATLEHGWRRYFGLGNATGLGMVPYVINHPQVLDAWVALRELPLANALATNWAPGSAGADRVVGLLNRAANHFAERDRLATEPYPGGPELASQLADVAQLAGSFQAGECPPSEGLAALVHRRAGELGLECRSVVDAIVVEVDDTLEAGGAHNRRGSTDSGPEGGAGVVPGRSHTGCVVDGPPGPAVGRRAGAGREWPRLRRSPRQSGRSGILAPRPSTFPARGLRHGELQPPIDGLVTGHTVLRCPSRRRHRGPRRRRLVLHRKTLGGSTVTTNGYIDGLQISNWSRETILENQTGGVHAFNATCAVWEGPMDTIRNIGDWYVLLRQNPDLARLVESAADLDRSMADGVVGVLLGFQNTSPFADDYTLVEVFHRLGVRVAQLTYNIRNLVGGSCYDAEDAGLTSFGHTVIGEMNRLGMVVDLSHVGNRTSRDAVDASAQPVAITHANPLWFVDTPRNKPDDVIEAVARSGGIVGLCLYPNVIGGHTTTRRQFCQMVADVVAQIGVDAVALASDSVRGWTDDYVGYLRNGRWRPPTPGEPAASWPQWPDWFGGPADFPHLAEGLSEVGLDDGAIAKVTGANWHRYFHQVLSGGQR